MCLHALCVQTLMVLASSSISRGDWHTCHLKCCHASVLPLMQLKLDEARAVQEMDTRMAAAAQQRAEQAAGVAPPPGPPGRTVSNLQLEVQAEHALADEQEGEAGTAQTLLELCSREMCGVVWCDVWWRCCRETDVRCSC